MKKRLGMKSMSPLSLAVHAVRTLASKAEQMVMLPLNLNLSFTDSDSDSKRTSLLDIARYAAGVLIWMLLSAFKLLMDMASSSSSSSSFFDANDNKNNNNNNSNSSAMVPRDSAMAWQGQPIARALSQVLTLINDIPVTSRKYEFARDLAEKIISENAKQGEPALQEINRKALAVSFGRTLRLLTSILQTMQNKQKHEESSSWTSRFFNVIPLYSQLMPSLENVRGSLLNILQPQPNVLSVSQAQLAMASNNNALAEKLVQELSWIANKLNACAAMEEAISQWSTATSLAALSIASPPRVQGYLVKISVLFFKEIAKDSDYISEQTRFNSLIIWLPLLCYAMNGVDSPVLSGLERQEVEMLLEETILTLPNIDQEAVLTNWLNDYICSSSDWPNLERGYRTWCQASRNLV